MRRLILPVLFIAGLLGLQGCAIYKDKDGVTHVEALPPPPVYVAPPVYAAPPAYYAYPAPYYGPYYYPGGYYRWR